jgi:hypothetical protein
MSKVQSCIIRHRAHRAHKEIQKLNLSADCADYRRLNYKLKHIKKLGPQVLDY